LSSRPAGLPSTAVREYSPVTGTQTNRLPYAPRADSHNVVQSPRKSSLEPNMPTNIVPVATYKETHRRSSPGQTSLPGTSTTPERADSRISMRSRDSPNSMDRTLSKDSISSMKRSVSRDSLVRKGHRQFIVKNKASRSYRNTSAHLSRTPSSGKGVHHTSFLNMTQMAPSNQDIGKASTSNNAVINPHSGSGNAVRRKSLSMSTTEPGPLSTLLMRRTVSGGTGTLFDVRSDN